MAEVKKFGPGDEVCVEFLEGGHEGRDCVRLVFPHGIKIKIALSDAETVGEALIMCVRAAEKRRRREA